MHPDGRGYRRSMIVPRSGCGKLLQYGFSVSHMRLSWELSTLFLSRPKLEWLFLGSVCTLDPMKTVRFIEQPTPPVDEQSERFVSALDELDLDAARRVPKSDLHNHGALGMRYASLAKIEPKVTPPLPSFGSLKRFLSWTAGEMRRISRDAKIGPRLFQAAVEDAIADGVTVLEMSFDLGIGRALGRADNFARLAADLRDKYADYIRLKPEIGVKKTDDSSTANDYLVALINCGVFESIDLYGAEVFPLLLGRWKRR
jgi:hypothetical protein